MAVNINLRFRLSVVLLLAVGGFSAPVYPTESAGQAQFVAQALLDLSLEDLLDVEVMVASKKPETLFDAPSSVSVFTRRELQAMGIDSVEALLNFVPGFIATREIVFGPAYMVAARGQTTPQASYNILFMLNGQRLNTDLSGGALDVNHWLPVATIERVEIIRGPGSALYGTSAFSGVVNIITAGEVNKITTRMGSFGSRSAHVSLWEAYGDWRMSLSADSFSDEGQAYTDPATRDPREGRDVLLTLKHRGFRLDLRHHRRETRDFYSAGEVNNGTNAFDPEQNFLHFEYRLLENAHWQWDLEGGYLQSKTESLAEVLSATAIQNLPDTIVTTGRDAMLGVVVIEEQEWHLGIDGHYQLSDKHEILTGIHWRRPEVTDFHWESNYDYGDYVTLMRSSLPGDLRYYGEVIPNYYLGMEKRDILGIYAQSQYQFNPQWAMTLGLRYDRYSDFGNTLNPRLAWTYSPTPAHKLKLIYGEAFRAPAVRQIAIPGLGNPGLEPEKIKTLELAWLQKYGPLQTSLTWFQSRAEDKIDTVLTPAGLREFANTTSLTTAGLELEAVARFDNGFSLRGAYTYLYETETDPRRFPEQTLSLIANYHYDNWNFNLNTWFHDEVEQDIRGGTLTLDRYQVLNSHVRYALSKHITLTGTFYNLLNEDFYTSSKRMSMINGVPNRGRSGMFGIEILF